MAQEVQNQYEGCWKESQLNRSVVALLALLVLGLSVSSVRASVVDLAYDGPYYVGRIQDGIPNKLDVELFYINQLVQLTTTAPKTITTPSGDPTNCNNALNCTDTYYRNLTLTNLPQVSSGVRSDDDVSNAGISMVGFQYILGKYDADKAGAYVWYVPGLTASDTVTLPATLGGENNNQHRLSHYSRFSVPDGGMTLMLLGGALFGLETLRRRLSA